MKQLIIYPFILLASYCFSQTKTNKSNGDLIISGYVTDSVLKNCNGKVDIIIYNEYRSIHDEGIDTIHILLKNNRFHIKLRPKLDLIYFSIKGGNLYLNSIDNQPFIAQSGDSLFMNFKSLREVEFSGKGSDKLNFQTWVYNLSQSGIKDYIKVLKDKDGLGIIYYSKLYAGNSIKRIVDRLDSISNGWSNEIKQILILNAISSVNLKFVENITMPLGAQDSLYSKAVHTEIGYLLYQQSAFVSSNFRLGESYMYTQYLYKLNKLYFIVQANKSPFKHYVSDKSMSRFSLTFKNVKYQYSGTIRDQLLLLMFQEMKKFNSIDAINYLPEAIGIVRDKKTKAVLTGLQTAKTKGSKAYPFVVEGYNRKQIKLNEFAGKVVILDTYYNGCMPCAWLAKNMEPIVDHFKDRDDVVFISLDALSKDRKKFEEGVRLGIYGSKYTIYSWVGPLMTNHPFIKFYKYYSYPNLLIIDKEGNVISADPPKPFSTQEKKHFIEMIEKEL